MTEAAASLTVIYGEFSTRMDVGKVFNIDVLMRPVDVFFKNCSTEQQENSFCARISPSVKMGREVLEYIYFSTFTFQLNKIDFDGTFVLLERETEYTLIIINPVMIPMPNSLNNKITAVTETCHITLFSRSELQKPVLERTISGPWQHASAGIKMQLAVSGYNIGNLHVGQVKEAERFPESEDLVFIDEFFADMTNAKKFMLLYCEIDASSKNSSETPCARTQVSLAPNGKVHVRKYVDDIEMYVYREGSVFMPGCLPRVDSITKLEASGHVEYLMEFLEPIGTQSFGLHSYFDRSRAANRLYSTCKFMLDCLYQMHLIHEKLHLVHADISPANIMYSKIDRIWKLIDFNLALDVSKSETTSRVAGTPEYIAPEALASGIFTKACDVWSLGQIGFTFFMQFLTAGVYCDSDSETEGVPDWMQKCCDRVVGCFSAMMSSCPEDRPTVVDVIRVFYYVIFQIKPNYDKNDLVLSGVYNLLDTIEMESYALLTNKSSQ